jgi:hypothetical protein
MAYPLSKETIDKLANTTWQTPLNKDQFPMIDIEPLDEPLPGEWVRLSIRDAIRVWDDGKWLEFSTLMFWHTGISVSQRTHPQLTKAEITLLKNKKQEAEDEAERLALRQLLAESQGHERSTDQETP